MVVIKNAVKAMESMMSPDQVRSARRAADRMILVIRSRLKVTQSPESLRRWTRDELHER